MGLDLIALSNVIFIDVEKYDENTDNVVDVDGTVYKENQYIKIKYNEDFPEVWHHSIVENIYIKNELKNKFSFSAGSYSGYNKWRNMLGYMSNFSNMTNDPFYNLINFSDCDGAISSSTAKKLYKDFCDYDHIAPTYDDEYFYLLYSNMKKGFELASNDGVLIFN